MEAAIAANDGAMREPVAELAPVQASERIHALDIVRGFALIGIFLMNVEWFTRPISELGTGVDVSQTGIHYFASWFVYTFVQGKFWTMFSLLFGMGFAVMLGRAESTERAFVAPYIRRIIGLFLFGSAHYVLVWTGDILHNYAFTAVFLLLIATDSWKVALGMLLTFAATSIALGAAGKEEMAEPFGLLAALMVMCGLLLFRNFIYRYVAPHKWKWIFGLLALVGVAYAIAQAKAALPAAGVAGGLIVLASLMYKLNKDAVARYWKWGVILYSLPFLISLIAIGVNAIKPQDADAGKARQEQVAQKTEATPSADSSAKPAAAKPDAKPAEKDEATRRAERKAEREKERKELVALYTTGSFWESIVYRAKEYAHDIQFAAGLSGLALPMFLIGFWFVRSGVIGNIREHLPLFRRLAMIVLPIGLAMTLTSVSLQSSYLNADWDDPIVRLARTLFQWAMMPQCIGYVALMICLIYTKTGEKLLSPLRYAGQMALTNYIGANAIGMFFFSGYGLGYYGQVPRGGQVLFVFVVFALQLLFSMWWLSKFRYGPLEWVWRAITYWQLPPMRRAVTV